MNWDYVQILGLVGQFVCIGAMVLTNGATPGMTSLALFFFWYSWFFLGINIGALVLDEWLQKSQQTKLTKFAGV